MKGELVGSILPRHRIMIRPPLPPLPSPPPLANQPVSLPHLPVLVKFRLVPPTDTTSGDAEGYANRSGAELSPDSAKKLTWGLTAAAGARIVLSQVCSSDYPLASCHVLLSASFPHRLASSECPKRRHGLAGLRSV